MDQSAHEVDALRLHSCFFLFIMTKEGRSDEEVENQSMYCRCMRFYTRRQRFDYILRFLTEGHEMMRT